MDCCFFPLVSKDCKAAAAAAAAAFRRAAMGT